MIIYRKLISEKFKDWTASEKIVYSYLLNKAIMTGGYFYVSKNGTNRLVLGEVCSDTWLDIKNVSMAKISKDMGISRRNITYTYRNLERRNVLGEERVFVIDGVADKGYINLLEGYNLRLEHLVFFSWYKDYMKSKNNKDYTCLEKLASFYGTDFKGISHLMSALAEKKLLQRTREGNQYYTEITDSKEKDINDIVDAFENIDKVTEKSVSYSMVKEKFPYITINHNVISANKVAKVRTGKS